MNLIQKIKVLFRKKPVPVPEPQKTTTRLKKACKGCGKTFSYDPSWDHIPNYCKDCKKISVMQDIDDNIAIIMESYAAASISSSLWTL